MIDGSQVGIVLFNAILLSPLHSFKYVLLIGKHIINVQIVLFIGTGITEDIKFVTNRNLRYLCWNLLKIHNGMRLIGNWNAVNSCHWVVVINKIIFVTLLLYFIMVSFFLEQSAKENLVSADYNIFVQDWFDSLLLYSEQRVGLLFSRFTVLLLVQQRIVSQIAPLLCYYVKPIRLQTHLCDLQAQRKRLIHIHMIYVPQFNRFIIKSVLIWFIILLSILQWVYWHLFICDQSRTVLVQAQKNHVLSRTVLYDLHEVRVLWFAINRHSCLIILWLVLWKIDLTACRKICDRHAFVLPHC